MSGSLLSRRDFLRARAPSALVGRASSAARAAVQEDVVSALCVAQLDPRRCLGAVSQICTVCIERCPVPGALRVSGLVPALDLARCTGCGLCVVACPAPESALRLIPRTGVRP